MQHCTFDGFKDCSTAAGGTCNHDGKRQLVLGVSSICYMGEEADSLSPCCLRSLLHGLPRPCQPPNLPHADDATVACYQPNPKGEGRFAFKMISWLGPLLSIAIFHLLSIPALCACPGLPQLLLWRHA